MVKWYKAKSLFIFFLTSKHSLKLSFNNFTGKITDCTLKECVVATFVFFTISYSFAIGPLKTYPNVEEIATGPLGLLSWYTPINF